MYIHLDLSFLLHNVQGVRFSPDGHSVVVHVHSTDFLLRVTTCLENLEMSEFHKC